MDIQMPVMDGLEATRTMRASERKRGISDGTPIIAVTANARPQDIETCYAAGCTAHLSKPISKQKLFNVIAQYGRVPRADSCPQPIQIEIPEGLGELVPGYIAARRLEYVEMLALLASSDFDRVCVLAHNMKGEGASYGLPELTELGASLERSAKEADHASVQANLHRLGDYLGRVTIGSAN